jgi:hypothetical protein
VLADRVGEEAIAEMVADQVAVDPVAADPAVVDPAVVDPAVVAGADQVAADQVVAHREVADDRISRCSERSTPCCRSSLSFNLLAAAEVAVPKVLADKVEGARVAAAWVVDLEAAVDRAGDSVDAVDKDRVDREWAAAEVMVAEVVVEMAQAKVAADLAVAAWVAAA